MSQVVVSHHEADHGTVRSYTVGFLLSIILTLVAYGVTARQLTNGWALIYALAALAVTQLFVQLVFFLHLSRRSQSRWNLIVLAFAGMVVFILVFGSLWIMHHLNAYHDNLTPQQLNQSIIKDEGYRPSSY